MGELTNRDEDIDRVPETAKAFMDNSSDRVIDRVS